MQKKFHNALLGISVLPALMIMPAMGYDIVDNIDLNTVFEDGVITEELYSGAAKVGTLTTPSITITGDESIKYLVLVNGEGSVLNLGTSENPVGSINITNVGDNSRGITVWDGGVANIYGKNINITADAQGFTTWGNYTENLAGSATMVGDNINITASNAIMVNETTNLGIRAKDINLSGDNGISVWTGVEEDDDGNVLSYYPGSGGKVRIDTGDLTINSTETGIGANYMKSQVTVNAEGDVNIVAHGSDDTRAIHVGNSTTNPDIAKEDTSFVSIKAKNINLTADNIGVSAMSNGWVDLDGNVTIKARDAILARGQSTVNVNESGKNTVKMDGNLAFDYYGANSGSEIDAKVNVVLNGADSYWTGNTVVSYGYYIAYQKDGEGNPLTDENDELVVYRSTKPTNVKMQVNSSDVTLQNGAVWNATKITDYENVVRGIQRIGTVDYPADLYEGVYYNALNNLTINNGTVNIADMDRGIVVENANIADATFNGGVLNVKDTLNVTAGTSVFNTDVAGNGTLTIANGATMDVGTQNIAIKKIVLNGTMNAKLNDTNDFVKFNVADSFDGAGTLNLSLYNTGEYKIFDAATFDNRKININVSSVLFDYVWNDDFDTLSVSMKSVEEIAEDNGLSGEAAATVTNLVNSSSEKLNALADAIQDSLAAGDTGAVEHAHAAINPETESVVQSVAASIQNTVANLTTGRLAAVSMGRSGGDVDITGVGVWAQGIYNKSKQNGAFNGYTRSVAGGVDMTLNRAWMLGAGYSYAHSDISGTARNTDVDSSTIFVYGQYKPTAWFVNAMANYTMSDYSERGIALGAGVAADYDVRAWGGHVMTGYDFAGGITPAIGLRYMHVSADDYKNSLGIKNSLKDSDYLTAVLDTRWNYNAKLGKDWVLSPELHYAVKYDFVSDENTVTVLMPGVNSYVMDGNRLSRIGAEFGAGLGVKYRGVDLTLNYDIELREGYTSQTGRVKARYEF